jgi:multidrug efflux pump
MQLAETSIRRPVFATVLSLMIVLIGAVSFNRLTVREYPKIDEPVVSVTTVFTGASSEVMESQVTKVLEDSLAGIEGVDVITSTSRQERSQISVRFALTRDADSAAADVRDKVTRVRQRLPQGIDEPVIAKVEADAFPVIFLAMSSDTHNALQLSEMANTLVKPILQTAPGAAANSSSVRPTTRCSWAITAAHTTSLPRPMVKVDPYPFHSVSVCRIT